MPYNSDDETDFDLYEVLSKIKTLQDFNRLDKKTLQKVNNEFLLQEELIYTEAKEIYSDVYSAKFNPQRPLITYEIFDIRETLIGFGWVDRDKKITIVPHTITFNKRMN